MNELEVKAAVRERDGVRCQDCGKPLADRFRNGKRRRLEVHRLVPGSAYAVDGCVTLCRKCHKARHRKTRPEGHCRLPFDTDNTIHKAIQLRKVKLPHGVSLSDVIDGILRGAMPPLTEELAALKQLSP